jgi:hypothetical protein
MIKAKKISELNNKKKKIESSPVILVEKSNCQNEMQIIHLEFSNAE